jgi:hypothetical protein
VNLLCTIQNALVFISKSGKRTYRLETSSLAITHDWFLSVEEFEYSVASSDTAWTIVGEVNFVEFKGTDVLVSNVIFSTHRNECLRTVGHDYFFSSFSHLNFNFSARTHMFNFNICSGDGTLVFVGYVVNSTNFVISPWTIGAS